MGAKAKVVNAGFNSAKKGLRGAEKGIGKLQRTGKRAKAGAKPLTNSRASTKAKTATSTATRRAKQGAAPAAATVRRGVKPAATDIKKSQVGKSWKKATKGQKAAVVGGAATTTSGAGYAAGRRRRSRKK